jgi:hypothetical protein
MAVISMVLIGHRLHVLRRDATLTRPLPTQARHIDGRPEYTYDTLSAGLLVNAIVKEALPNGLAVTFLGFTGTIDPFHLETVVEDMDSLAEMFPPKSKVRLVHSVSCLAWFPAGLLWDHKMLKSIMQNFGLLTGPSSLGNAAQGAHPAPQPGDEARGADPSPAPRVARCGGSEGRVCRRRDR